MIEHARTVRRQVTGDREQILVPLRVDERHLCSAQRGFAHAMRQQGRLLAQICADDEHRGEILDVCERAAERGIQRFARVVAKVRAAQAMIQIGAAEAARPVAPSQLEPQAEVRTHPKSADPRYCAAWVLWVQGD